jgi:hypothetical protein
VTILVLAAVCISLAALTFKSQQALANMHPMIVRINDVGHAEAIDYRNFQYRPQEAENKYYLTRWAELYFSRNRFTIERDQTQSLSGTARCRGTTRPSTSDRALQEQSPRVAETTTGCSWWALPEFNRVWRRTPT